MSGTIRQPPGLDSEGRGPPREVRRARGRAPEPQRIDWNKFTNFRSRNTRKDLERLLNGLASSRSRRKELLEQPDRVGLYPVHWAAINNRSDMIERLYEAGSPLAKPCRNRLLANGTPLHLAAMNGSLEAAAMLLAKSSELQEHKTRPKSLVSPNRDDEKHTNGVFGSNGPVIADEADGDDETKRLLNARDAEGQTPLMRTAAPRSKRMDALRDLLRKNSWSLSGRPAEMALYLICMGADWRQTEPQSGMNLLHLAIVNDYDDIVSLVLVLDRNLTDTPTQRATNQRPQPPAAESSRLQGAKASERNKPTVDADTGRQSTGYSDTNSNATPMSPGSTSSPGTATSDSEDDTSGVGSSSATTTPPASPSSEPLIDSSRNMADELLATGLKPLQLAILYGRVSMISPLWHASQKFKHRRARQGNGPGVTSQVEVQQEAIRDDKQSQDQRELKQILIRSCYSNKHELAKFLKPALLKGALALDLAVLALVWAPVYVSRQNFAGGLFIVSYVLSMALALRVMLRNPGFLRRNSVQYLSELARLLERRGAGEKQRRPWRQKTDQPSGVARNAGEKQTEQESRARLRRKSTAPLIKLEPSDGEQQTVAMGPPASEGQLSGADESPDGQSARPVVSLASAPVPVDAFRDLQDKVRLFCHKCQCIRRPRSSHCNACNHCVQDFDHHCIYLGACVGRHNRLDFLMAMVALAITSIYGTVLHSLAPEGGGGSSFWHGLGLVWVCKYVLIGGLAAFLNLRRACIGVTLYEEVRSKRIRRIFGRAGPPNEIAKSHRAFSTSLKDSFWRYAPDRFLTGDLSARQIFANLREFTNYLAPDEYLLTFICTDTALARSLTSSDSRMKQLYKFV